MMFYYLTILCEYLPLIYPNELEEEFEDTKGAIRNVYRRGIDNTMAKRKSTKGLTTIHKTYI